MRNSSFIKSHGSLLKDQGRLRVANQLLAVIEDWFGKSSLKQLEVLDFGCSNGVITSCIAGYTKKIVGIDIDEMAINEAKKRFSKNNLSFALTKTTKLPYKNKSFDLVICNQVYSYLDDPELMAKENLRVLKDGGVCLFTGDNVLRIIEPLYNLPFIRLLPTDTTQYLLRILGYKNIYIGKYKTYWGLKRLFSKYTIYDYTIKILKNPKKFKYTKLEKYHSILSIIPSFVLRIFEPFFSSFIFILKK